MDKLDLKILSVLDWHGRMPVKQIAKRVRSNKDVVAYRMRKLEEEEIIVRYYPVIDMHKLGYQTSRIYFDIEEIDENAEERFVRFLDREIHAGLIFRMDYPYRYGIFLWTRSVYDIEQALQKIKKHLGKALLRYTYSLICTLRQYPKDYLFGKILHTASRSLIPMEAEPIDEKELRILHALAQNARSSTVELAKQLKIPQTTVSAKIKQLEKRKIIQGYRAEIDFIKLGYMNYFLEIYLKDTLELRPIEAWADACPHVVWLQKIIGTCDLEIEVEVKDRTALERLLNDLRHRFKSIRKIVFWSQAYKKLTFLP